MWDLTGQYGKSFAFLTVPFTRCFLGFTAMALVASLHRSIPGEARKGGLNGFKVACTYDASRSGGGHDSGLQFVTALSRCPAAV
jgi:hypothetical protein